MTPARRSIALVAAREITERTRSRAFALSTIAIVAVVVAAVVVPGLSDDTTHLRAGATGATPPALVAALRDAAEADGARLELRLYPSATAGERAVRDEQVDVLIVDGRRLVWKSEPDAALNASVTAAAQRVHFAQRAAELGLSEAQAATLLAPVPVPARRLEALDPDQDSREAIAMISYLVLLLMVIWYGTAVADGVAQEKGGRVMEQLVSRIRARDLLAGKVAGIGLVGLAQLIVAVLAATVAILAFETVEVPDAVPATLASCILWFALGYLFWSVAYATVAALVSRVEDLQSAVAPVGWTLVLSALTAPVAAELPDEWYMLVASLFPTTAPFVMPVRIAVSDVPVWEIALAAAIMLVATAALIRLAGAVYSGALLRTGGRPTLREVWAARAPAAGGTAK
jgi:ABC-2 type transport system permease protein